MLSVTSWLDNLYGIPDKDKESWIVKEAVLSVIREAKKQGRILTQEEAKQLGLDACQKILRNSQHTGIEVHQFARNTVNGLPYELEEELKPHGEAFYNWFKDQKMRTILDEAKVENLQYGYAGRLDWYGELNGELVLLDYKTSKQLRWTYWLQLAAYRKCLEDMGYRVDKMYLLHVKPKKRGGIPRAELTEVQCPFELVASSLQTFRFKLSLEPFVDWYERTDEEAIKKDLDTMSKPLSVQQSDAQGHQLGTQVLSPSSVVTTTGTPGEAPQTFYPYQEGISILSPFLPGYSLAVPTPTIHNSSQQGIPVEQTSELQKVIPPGTHILVSNPLASVPRILLEISAPPLERHTLVRRPEDSDDELDSPPKPRQDDELAA